MNAVKGIPMHRLKTASLVLLASLSAVCAAQRAPVIQAFIAYPPEIVLGETSSLVWEVSGATSLRLEPDIGEVTGPFLFVQPLATTTYTLKATNDAGTAQASVTVTVVAGGNAEEDADRDDPEDCTALGSGAISGALTLDYSGSAQGDASTVGVARRADISLMLEPTPYGHWAGAATTGSAAIHDTFNSTSLDELIEGEGAPLQEPATLRVNEDCTLSARVVLSVEAQNSTVFGVATSTVGVVYLEGVAVSGEADLKAHTWHFGGESGVSLTQGQNYVEGFAQDLGMLLGHDALGNARVTWNFTPVR